MSILTEIMKQQLADLRRRFDEGELTGDELSTLMFQAIETEIEKPAEEMNDEWLTACGELMAYADRDKLAQLPDHSEQLRSDLVTAIHQEQKAQRMRIAYRAALTATCFLLVLIGVSYSKQWFHPSQSVDEQVYTLTGQKVEFGVDNCAVADVSDELRECETVDFQELCDFLGFVPQIPTWVPDGWELYSYYASVDHISMELTVAYGKEDEEYLLLYDYIQTEDVAAISVDYYQDKTGEYVKLNRNLKLYLATNMDKPVAIWTTADTISSVTGPISVEDLKALILSIS